MVNDNQIESANAPRILSLTLHTSAPLPMMRDFYQGILGFPITGEKSNQITFRAGGTTLTFVHTAHPSADPAYHFAFNIPENKVLSARHWLAERTPLINPRQDHLHDPRFPEEVVHFSHWQAHSVFFYDPAENVVETIARHDLDNRADGPFTTEDILYASEIAFIVDDVGQAARALSERTGLQPYQGGSPAFTALGDERGLLLVMQRGRKAAFGRGRARDVFPTQAVIRGKRNGGYEMPGYPYQITLAAPAG